MGWIIGWAIEFKFLAWHSVAQLVCQRAFSWLEIRFQRTWIRILHSAEEDNLSPFDPEIACLCQRIEINNNKHVCYEASMRAITYLYIEGYTYGLIFSNIYSNVIFILPHYHAIWSEKAKNYCWLDSPVNVYKHHVWVSIKQFSLVSIYFSNVCFV